MDTKSSPATSAGPPLPASSDSRPKAEKLTSEDHIISSSSRSEPEFRQLEAARRGGRWLLFGRLAVGLFIIAYVLVSTHGWGREWSDKILYAGYFPMGISLERIFRDMPKVPFKDEVWPKFLRENAVKVFKLEK